jgi:hypothetical protein
MPALAASATTPHGAAVWVVRPGGLSTALIPVTTRGLPHWEPVACAPTAASTLAVSLTHAYVGVQDGAVLVFSHPAPGSPPTLLASLRASVSAPVTALCTAPASTRALYVAAADGSLLHYCTSLLPLSLPAESEEPLLVLSPTTHLLRPAQRCVPLHMSHTFAETPFPSSQTVQALAVDEIFLYSGADDGVVHVWDLRSHVRLRELSLASAAVSCLLRAGPTALWVGTEDGTVVVVDVLGDDEHGVDIVAEARPHSTRVSALHHVSSERVWSVANDDTSPPQAWSIQMPSAVGAVDVCGLGGRSRPGKNDDRDGHYSEQTVRASAAVRVLVELNREPWDRVMMLALSGPEINDMFSVSFPVPNDSLRAPPSSARRFPSPATDESRSATSYYEEVETRDGTDKKVAESVAELQSNAAPDDCSSGACCPSIGGDYLHKIGDGDKAVTPSPDVEQKELKQTVLSTPSRPAIRDSSLMPLTSSLRSPYQLSPSVTKALSISLRRAIALLSLSEQDSSQKNTLSIELATASQLLDLCIEVKDAGDAAGANASATARDVAFAAVSLMTRNRKDTTERFRRDAKLADGIIREANAQLALAEKARRDMSIQLARVEIERDEIITALRSQLFQSEERLVSVEADRDMAAASLKEQLSLAYTAIESASIELTDAKSERDSLAQDLSLLESESEATMQSLERVIKDQQGKIVALDETAVENQSGAERIAADYRSLDAQLIKAKCDISALEESNFTVHHDLRAAHRQVFQAGQKLAVAEERIQADNTDRTALEIELAKMHDSAETLKLALRNSENSVLGKVAELATYASTLDAEILAHGATQQSLTDARMQHLISQQLLEDQTKQILLATDASKTALEDSHQQTESLEQRVKALYLDLETKTAETHDALAALQEMSLLLDEEKAAHRDSTAAFKEAAKLSASTFGLLEAERHKRHSAENIASEHISRLDVLAKTVGLRVDSESSESAAELDRVTLVAKEASDRLVQATRHMTQLASERLELESSICRRNTEIDALLKQIASLQKDVTCGADEISALRLATCIQREELDASRSAFNKIHQALVALQDEFDKTHVQGAGLEREVCGSKPTACNAESSMRSDLPSSTTDTGADENELAPPSLACRCDENREEALLRQIAALERANQSRETELVELRTTVDDKDAALNVGASQVQSLQTELDSTCRALNSQIGATAALAGRLADKDDRCEQMELKFAHIEDEVKTRRHVEQPEASSEVSSVATYVAAEEAGEVRSALEAARISMIDALRTVAEARGMATQMRSSVATHAESLPILLELEHELKRQRLFGDHVVDGSISARIDLNPAIGVINDVIALLYSDAEKMNAFGPDNIEEALRYAPTPERVNSLHGTIASWRLQRSSNSTDPTAFDTPRGAAQLGSQSRPSLSSHDPSSMWTPRRYLNFG